MQLHDTNTHQIFFKGEIPKLNNQECLTLIKASFTRYPLRRYIALVYQYSTSEALGRKQLAVMVCGKTIGILIIIVPCSLKFLTLSQYLISWSADFRENYY